MARMLLLRCIHIIITKVINLYNEVILSALMCHCKERKIIFRRQFIL
jgi:hypothetical protein